ncbi:MAG: hypothetical protein GY810_09880 [Aureispira sp.]|nr:hypothetical protein [Aureispira sp.]
MKIFIILTALFVSNLGNAQKYSFPKEVNFYGDLQADNFEGSNFGLHDSFFPIGWSSDGKFAYIKETANEAGMYFIGLYIQNVITDKIIAKKVYPIEEDGADDIQSLGIWEKHYSTFERLLSKHNISSKHSPQLIKKKTFEIADIKYAVKLESKRDKLDGMNYFGAITHAKIYLTSKKLGTKRVYSYKEIELPNMLDINIVGYFKSPWENRIIIVSEEVGRGYEGPPHVHGFILTGAHLLDGFK